MASIIDAFKESFGDKRAFLKFVVLAVPVYYCYNIYLSSKGDYGYFSIIAGLTLFLLFGFLIEVTGNVINENDSVLPSLNPFKLGFASAKGLLAILPSSLVSMAVASYVCSIININPTIDITLKSIIWIIVASIFLTSFLMFAKRERVSDAYNLKMLFKNAGDLIAGIIFFILLIIIINIPTTGFIGYMLFILFGFGPVLNFFLAIAIVFNIALTGHYMAQLHYDILQYDK